MKIGAIIRAHYFQFRAEARIAQQAWDARASRIKLRRCRLRRDEAARKFFSARANEWRAKTQMCLWRAKQRIAKPKTRLERQKYANQIAFYHERSEECEDEHARASDSLRDALDEEIIALLDAFKAHPTTPKLAPVSYTHLTLPTIYSV